MRKRFVAAVATAALSVGLITGLSASAATPNDTECRKVASQAQPASGVNSAEVLEYNACRFDKIDSEIQGKPVTPSPTPTASPSASPTPSVSLTPTVTPTPTPSVSARPTASPTATSAPTTAFPDATTTGVPAGTVLSNYTGPTNITVAGTVIDSKKVTGCLVIKANNVTIKNSLMQSNGCYWNILNDDGNTGLVVQDSEIDGLKNTSSDASIGGYNYTCLRCNIHGTSDGLKAGNNVTVKDSWIHDPAQTADSHNDGIQSLGTNNLNIIHNRIVMPDGSTSAVILSTGSADEMRNVKIDNNLVGGGAYTIYGGYASGRDTLSKVSNIVISNNKFTTAIFPKSGGYGPLTSTDSPVVVTGNVWYDGPNKGKTVS